MGSADFAIPCQLALGADPNLGLALVAGRFSPLYKSSGELAPCTIGETTIWLRPTLELKFRCFVTRHSLAGAGLAWCVRSPCVRWLKPAVKKACSLAGRKHT